MADLKKVPVKVNEAGEYVDIFPETYADVVYLDNERSGNVRDKLKDLTDEIADVEETVNAAAVLTVSATEPAAPKANMIWIKP